MDINIRLATNEDQESILQLLNRVFAGQQRSAFIRDNNYWKWKYLDNPFGNALITVAEYHNKIIGVDSLLPWEFKIRNSVLKALQPCESAVDSEHRSKRIFTKMRMHGVEIASEKNAHFIYNFPNKNSLITNLSLGWHYMGKIPWWVKVLKPIRIINETLSKEKAIPMRIDGPYSVDAAVLDQTAYEDSNFDGYVKSNRIQGFHKWRYSNHPIRSYGMVQYKSNKKSTTAIFTVNQNGTNREMIIVDLIGSVQNTISVIKMILHVARETNVSFVTIMHNKRYKTQDLWKLGFFKWNLKNMAVLPLNLNLENILKDYSNWSMMAGIHDSI